MTELEAFEWWKTERDEAGYKQSEIAKLSWQAACKWQREMNKPDDACGASASNAELGVWLL